MSQPASAAKSSFFQDASSPSSSSKVSGKRKAIEIKTEGTVRRLSEQNLSATHAKKPRFISSKKFVASGPAAETQAATESPLKQNSDRLEKIRPLILSALCNLRNVEKDLNTYIKKLQTAKKLLSKGIGDLNRTLPLCVFSKPPSKQASVESLSQAETEKESEEESEEKKR